MIFEKSPSILSDWHASWPVRGIKPFALERLEWSGKTPFEIERITIEPDGFKIAFTKPTDAAAGRDPRSYKIATFTHPYHAGYGGPEIDKTTPAVKAVAMSGDGRHATLILDTLLRGHVYSFDLSPMRSRDGGTVLHSQRNSRRAVSRGHSRASI